MKNKIVRAFVLALTGLGAVVITTTKPTTSAGTVRPMDDGGRLPPAVCPPDDPNACGLTN
jgi:hypothetical protein